MNRIKQVAPTTNFTDVELTKLINDLCCFCNKGSLNFDKGGALSNEDYFRVTGVTNYDFNKLFEVVKGSIHLTPVSVLYSKNGRRQLAFG